MKMEFRPYNAPAGGWGSFQGMAKRLAREGNPISASLVLMYQNKPRLGQARAAASVRVLRERCEGHDLGADAEACHARIGVRRSRWMQSANKVSEPHAVGDVPGLRVISQGVKPCPAAINRPIPTSRVSVRSTRCR